MDSITLYYHEGSSDKVYKADIVPAGKDLFKVEFAYGRRGQSLQTGTKTQSPVPYAKAKAVFDKLVSEKTGKGYTQGEDGTPYQGTPSEQRSTGISCQLLNAIEEAEVDRYVNDDRFCMQEKHNGRRQLVRRDRLTIAGINRKGLEIAISTPLAEAVAALSADCILDGEAVGDTLYVFDILSVEGKDCRHFRYDARLFGLTGLMFEHETPCLQLVKTAETTADKKELLRRVKAAGGEGVVFKKIDAPYTPGRPASGGPQLKFKFCETASCVVTGHNLKRSVSLGLYLNGCTIDCGNVTIPPDKPVPEVGAVVEVRYLYAFPDSKALFQPVYLGPRDDILPQDCDIDQLKYKPQP